MNKPLHGDSLDHARVLDCKRRPRAATLLVARTALEIEECAEDGWDDVVEACGRPLLVQPKRGRKGIEKLPGKIPLNVGLETCVKLVHFAQKEEVLA